MKKRHYLIGLLSLFLSTQLFAQIDSTSNGDLEDLSLEELMNVKIVSASRSEENAFDAPLSSYVITRKDIELLGPTSIPEALKLCPGLIVREISNGAYDVAIRGFENLATHEIQANYKLLLVMIDNRPVFNHFQGGTYWENLPVDLVDVERIEIVNGPSSPLYGPNAVMGVINIITRRPVNNGLFANAHHTTAGVLTNIDQASIGYRFNNKLSILGSINYQWRNRFSYEMYNADSMRFESNDSIANTGWSREFKNRKHKASEKFGTNIFVDYTPSDKVKLYFSTGFNKSDNLKSLTSTGMMSYWSNNSYYGNIKGEIYNFGLQTSYLGGLQDLTYADPYYQYDYGTFDFYLDYNLKIGDNLSIRPAISYQNANIDDRDYANEKGLFNKRASMTDMAGSVKVDYTFQKKLRLIGAVRADKFRVPKDIYISYQAMANYKPGKKHNIRLIAAQSNSGSFIVNSDINIIVFTQDTLYYEAAPGFFVPIPGLDFRQQGNTDYKLQQNQMFEVGYRVQPIKQMQFDIAYFHQEMKNFGTFTTQNAYGDAAALDAAAFKYHLVDQYQNLPMKAIQDGVTASVNLALLDGKLNIRPNVTMQQTTLKNYTQHYKTKDADTVNNIENVRTIEHLGSPKLFGGMAVSYNFRNKLTIGTTLYGIDKSRMYGFADDKFADDMSGHPISRISGKMTYSVKVTYRITDQFSIFFNGRNIFNNTKREFYGTDRLGALYMGGLSFQY